VPHKEPKKPCKVIGQRSHLLRTVYLTSEKVLPVLKVPDTGPEKNMMSESFASLQNFEIYRGPEDLKDFELGSGKSVRSVGRVRVSIQLPGITLQKAKRWFYVFENCPVDIILGMNSCKKLKSSLKIGIA
jgi:hypothetical protein